MTRRGEFIAVLLLNLFLGTLYSWSVVARAAEKEFGVGRADASSVFSTATACFVLAMLLTPRIYPRLTPRYLALLAAVTAASGLLLAALAGSLPGLLIGYGILFGLGNGVGYGLSLQVATGAASRRGLAVGAVVAAYAGGSIVAAPLLSWTASWWGLGGALGMLAGCLALLAVLCPWLLRVSEATGRAPAVNADGTGTPWFGRVFLLLWLGYALGASAGLMMIGHAAALVDWQRGTEALAVLGAALIAAGNWFGRLGAGWLSDFVAVRAVLIAALLLSGVALSLALFVASPAAAIVALGLVGTGYGVLAAGYPIAVGSFFGARRVGSVYGKLFTAWGAAGIAGPWVAGWTFETTGGYDTAMALAMAATLVAVIATVALPRPKAGEGT